MNILFIHDGPFRIFDKLDSGASVRNTLFVKALSQLGHVDVISFYKEDFKSNIDNCTVINARVDIPEAQKSFRGKKWLDLIFTPLSPYTYFPVNPEKERIIDEYCRANSYDYIACRYVVNAACCGLFKYQDKLILDVDDNPTNVYKLQTGDLRFLRAYKRWRLLIQGKMISRMIHKVLKKTFCSFYSNPLEKPSRRSVYLYNTTAIEEKVEDITDSTPCRIMTVGWLDYPPNQEGCKHFADKVFPLIKAVIPNTEFHIVGRCSNPYFIDNLNSVEGVRMQGFVDDITKEYQDSRVVIVPVYCGTGTSVKLIEGLMMNRPVVSTPIGARGFDHVFQEGNHFMTARDDKDFAEKAIALLKDAELSKRLAHNALKAGEKYFSQEGFMSTVRETVMNLSE